MEKSVYENEPQKPFADVRFELVPESKVATATLQQPEVAANFQRVSFSVKSASETHPWRFQRDNKDEEIMTEATNDPANPDFDIVPADAEPFNMEEMHANVDSNEPGSMENRDGHVDSDERAIVENRDDHVDPNEHAIVENRDGHVDSDEHAIMENRDGHVDANERAIMENRDGHVNTNEAFIEKENVTAEALKSPAINEGNIATDAVVNPALPEENVATKTMNDPPNSDNVVKEAIIADMAPYQAEVAAVEAQRVFVSSLPATNTSSWSDYICCWKR